VSHRLVILAYLLPLALALPACSSTSDDNDVNPDSGPAGDAHVDAETPADADPDGTPGEDAGPPPVVWTQVAAGTSHTCGLRSDGSLWCWGTGDHGRLGHGSEVGSLVPVRVLAAGEPPEGEAWDDWTDVATGGQYSCGIRADRSLWCWGLGDDGQRGDGTLAAVRTTPTRVLAAAEEDSPPWDDWTQVAIGSTHTCGLRADGSLWCWGAGTHGRRGDGETEDVEPRHTPTRVLAASGIATPWNDWAEVGVGQFFACGRRRHDDGSHTIWCWGTRSGGVLGVGSGSACFPYQNTGGRPVQVLQDDGCHDEDPDAGWTDWDDLTTGSRHNCGRRDGHLWCWGLRDDGRLGDGYWDGGGNVGSRPRLVLSSEDDDSSDTWDDWTLVSAGAAHTCAIREDASLWCWGSDINGRLGNGVVPTYTSCDTQCEGHPVQVLAAFEDEGGDTWDDWTLVSAGSAHTCGIREDGSLWCWGRGDDGRRGDGDDAQNRPAPRPVQEPAE
jgi:hypothetical protein